MGGSCGPNLSADDQSPVKWLNHDLFPPAGSAGLVSAPTTARNGPSERVTDGQRRRKASDTVPSELMMSRTAVKTRFCGNRHRQRFWTDLPLSATLSRSGPREWGRGSRGEWSRRSRTEMNKHVLRCDLNLRRRGRGALPPGHTAFGPGFRTQWGLYHSSL